MMEIIWWIWGWVSYLLVNGLWLVTIVGVATIILWALTLLIGSIRLRSVASPTSSPTPPEEKKKKWGVGSWPKIGGWVSPSIKLGLVGILLVLAYQYSPPLIQKTMVITIQPGKTFDLRTEPGWNTRPQFSVKSGGTVKIVPYGPERGVVGSNPDGSYIWGVEKGYEMQISAGDSPPQIPYPQKSMDEWKGYRISITSGQEAVVKVTFIRNWWPW